MHYFSKETSPSPSRPTEPCKYRDESFKVFEGYHIGPIVTQSRHPRHRSPSLVQVFGARLVLENDVKRVDDAGNVAEHREEDV